MENVIGENTESSNFIEELVSDRKKFDAFVYTPIDEALKEIELRRQNKDLDQRIESRLVKVPEIMEGKPKAVLFRNITTPNYETMWFNDVIVKFKKLEPLFLEYTKDKFTNRNECKFALGKITLHKGKNKKDEHIFEFQNIIDVNSSNCKPISSIKTFWDQPLVDFHHELFLNDFSHLKNNIFDFSDWLEKNGKTAKEYYELFLLLFIKHGILFENFTLKDNELLFTKEVVLPAFIKISDKIGMKPLIVALEPTETEEGKLWQAYPAKMKEHIKQKMSAKT